MQGRCALVAISLLSLQACAALNQLGTSALTGFIAAYFDTREVAPLAALDATVDGLVQVLARWSWDERTRDLFRWVDPDAWEVTVHDPVALLDTIPDPDAADLSRIAGSLDDQLFDGLLPERQVFLLLDDVLHPGLTAPEAVPLELVETRTFGSRVVFERYLVTSTARAAAL